jgi:hypothetical protein
VGRRKTALFVDLNLQNILVVALYLYIVAFEDERIMLEGHLDNGLRLLWFGLLPLPDLGETLLDFKMVEGFRGHCSL